MGNREATAITVVARLPDAIRARRTAAPKPARAPRRQLFINLKGGTGKTSLSTAYAWRLAELGHRVLMVDLDGQGHATRCLGHRAELCGRSLYDVMVDGVGLHEAIVAVEGMPNLGLVPCNLDMSGLETALANEGDRDRRLQKAVGGLGSLFDFVVMDAPPSFGLVNVNALLAATDVLVPVLPDFLSFDGLRLLLETVSELEQYRRHDIENLFVILNAYQFGTHMAKTSLQALQRHYPEYLLNTLVRHCPGFPESSGQGAPVGKFDPQSRGAHDVAKLVNEVLQKLEQDRSVSQQVRHVAAR